MKIEKRADLEHGQHVADEAAGADAAHSARTRTAQTAAIAMSVWLESVIAEVRQRNLKNGVRVVDSGNEAIEIEREEHGAGGHGAGKAGDKRRPAGQKPGEAARRLRAGRHTRHRRAAAARRAPRRPSRRRTRARRPPARSTGTAASSGTLAAMSGGKNRMPPPMTLATMMAAASRGPRRRSRVVGERVWSAWSLGQELSLDWKLGEFSPDPRSLLQKYFDFRVDEFLVLQHLQPRLLAGVAQPGPQHQVAGRRARRQADRAGRPSRSARPTFRSRRPA